MSARSNDPGKDIARLALAPHQFDGDLLEAVLAYCWDQLSWIRTDSQLSAIRDNLEVGEA